MQPRIVSGTFIRFIRHSADVNNLFRQFFLRTGASRPISSIAEPFLSVTFRFMKARISILILLLPLAFLAAGCGESSREAVQKRVEMVRTASNPAYLEKAALSDKSPAVRQAAVERIFDQELIEKILAQDDDMGVRMAALKRVRSPEAVARAATGDKSRYVRLAAVSLLSDQRTLAEVALTDKDRLVRITALGSIMDANTVRKVMASDKDARVRAAAEKRLNTLR